MWEHKDAKFLQASEVQRILTQKSLTFLVYKYIKPIILSYFFTA